MESLSKKTILVTGASGFIGSHLLERLKQAGSVVYALSRNFTPSKNDGIHWVKGDVSNLEELRNVFSNANPNIVFHLASQVTGNRDVSQIDPTLRSNLVSTVNLLTLVTQFKCERFVTIGSMEEPDVNSNDVPNSPYSAAKWAGTGYARMFFNLYNTPVVNATLYMVYGPDQKDMTKLIPYVTSSLLQGIAPKLSSGKRDVDWIYVSDVVDGLIEMAITPGVEGKIIDLGSGETCSIRSLIEKLVDIIKPDVSPFSMHFRNALWRRPGLPISN